jgi:transposase
MEVLYPHCAGLDVHKDTVVACVRHMVNGSVRREVRSFKTTTKELLGLSDWLAGEGCTHVAMEATGVYWKPVWHVLSDGNFTLVLANAAHVKNVPGRKTDVNDATWLADLLAHGLIQSSFVPDEQTQEIWIGNGSGECAPMLHNPHYDFNDAILPLGASYWVRLAEAILSKDHDTVRPP